MKAFTPITMTVMLLALLFSSCNMDFAPSDGLTQKAIEEDPNAALYVTLGNYSVLKDILLFRNAVATGNTYIRHYFQSTEFQGDNISISTPTSDQFYECMVYRHTPENTPTSYLWFAGYKLIMSANTVNAMIKEGVSAENDQLKGENLFLRALTHLHLVTLFAKPYSYGRDNLGIVIRTSTNITETKRATVGQTYDQIIADLKEAARLMTLDKGGAYASKAAALGLLSRVYLYMQDYEKAIQAADDCLAIRPETNLERGDNFTKYFANAATSNETLFAVSCTLNDDRGQSSIGSMYLSDGIGWGEIYASQSLRNLLNKNPNDLRHKFIKPKYLGNGLLPTENNQKAIFNHFEEVASDNGANRQITSILTPVYYWNGEYFTTTGGGGTKVTLSPAPEGSLSIAGTLAVNGTTKEGYLIPEIEDDRATGYPRYFVTKFSYQNDNPMLSSPVMLRLAEVILNRAEARFLKNNPDGAKDDVNIIRNRAGIPTLPSVTLDDILDERRMELCFEGHRAIDLFRNKMTLDRKYPGAHPAVTVNPNTDRFIYYIPSMEIETSGIIQN